jgi:uncharacterized protein YcfJ
MRQVWIWAITGTIVVLMVTALVLNAPAPANGEEEATTTPALSGDFHGNSNPAGNGHEPGANGYF